MNFIIKPLETLDTAELYKILQIRNEVFIVEQNCPYQDLDQKDQKSLHLWMQDAMGNITAYCRLLPAGVSYNEPSIGRVLTAANNRKEGLGRKLMETAIDYILNEWNTAAIRISAQLYLKDFYGSLGFQQIGDSYLEDNIPHIEMLMQK
jgi:ElaA protein